MANVMAWPLNLVDYAYNAEDVQRWMAGKSSGIYGQEGNYQVMAKEGRTVTVKAEGMVGGWLSNMGKYGVCFWNDLDIDLEVALGDGFNTRIDRVVVSWYIPQQATRPTVEIRQGTPAAQPVAPELRNDGEYAEICLAEITVPAGATEVTAGMIHDTRLDSELCGLVSFGIEAIPLDGLKREFDGFIADIKNQWTGTEQELNEWKTTQQASFQAWFDNLNYILDGDVAGHMLVEIDEIRKLAVKFDAYSETYGMNYTVNEAEDGTVTITETVKSGSPETAQRVTTMTEADGVTTAVVKTTIGFEIKTETYTLEEKSGESVVS